MAGALVLLALLSAGCMPEQYAKQADKTAYRAIATGQKAAIGQTKAFDITYRPIGLGSRPDSIEIGGKAIPVNGDKLVPLTLLECLEIAFRNSREYQTNKETLYIAALDMTNARRGWNAPKLNGGVTGNADESFDADAAQSTHTGAVAVNPSLAQQLVDGGAVTLGATVQLATDFLDYRSTPITSLVQANFTQPLLRGAWRGFAYEPQYRLERDFLIAVFQYERFRQTLSAQVVRQYYLVLQQRDQLENETANIQRLRETATLTRVLADGGQVSRIQLDQAENDLIQAQLRLQQDQESYRNALDTYKLLLGLPLTAGMDVDYPGELERLSGEGPGEIPFQEAQAVGVALAARPDLMMERAKVRDAGRDVQIAADAFLPQMDVVLGISAPGTPPYEAQRIKFHENTRTASVKFDYQFDQTDNRDDYRKSIIALEKSQRDLERFIDQIRLDVRQLYRTLTQSRQSYDLQKRNVEIAKRRRKLASLQQKEGQASARDVLEAEEALRQAQNGLTSTLISYTTTRLDFMASLGMLDVDEKGQIHERTDPYTFERIRRRYPYAGEQ